MASGASRKAARNKRPGRLTRLWRKVKKPAIVAIEGFTVEARPGIVGPVAARALRLGKYEWRERLVVGQVIRSDDRVLEGGGGLGIISMIIASIVGSQNLIVYEASPATADILEQNLQRNGFSVAVRRKGLTSSDGGERFAHDQDILASRFADDTPRSGDVVPTDDVRDVLKTFAPTILVLDIEGKEIEVICATDLDGVRAVIVEIHPKSHGDGAYVPVYRHLFDIGFVLRHHLSIDDVLLFERP